MKAGKEKCWPRAATSCSGSEGSHRSPACRLNLLDVCMSSWKYMPIYRCRSPASSAFAWLTELGRPIRKSTSASFVKDPLKLNEPLLVDTLRVFICVAIKDAPKDR